MSKWLYSTKGPHGVLGTLLVSVSLCCTFCNVRVTEVDYQPLDHRGIVFGSLLHNQTCYLYLYPQRYDLRDADILVFVEPFLPEEFRFSGQKRERYVYTVY